MNGKKIAFLSTILLLLVGFYYFYEVRYTGKQKEKAASSSKVLNIKDQDIESMCLRNPKGTVVLEKRENEWFLAEPIKARADTWAVHQIIDALANGTWQREITPLPEDLGDFGLVDPEIEVSLSGKGFSVPRKVLIGRKNPTGKMRYIRVDQEGRVLLVYTRLKDVLDKTYDDLRDKHILRFEKDDIFKIVWRADKNTFVAEKKENKWVLVEPPGKEIAESEIINLVWRVKSLKFKKIYEKPDHPVSYYSLDKPYGMIRLMDEEGQVIGKLSFGIRGPEASYYARVEGSNTVYELSYDFVKDLPKPEEEIEKEQGEA